MIKYFLFFFSLFILTKACIGQEIRPDAVKITPLSDTNKYSFPAGFYLTMPDSSKAQGFKLENTDEFYLIETKNSMSFKNMDSVFKDFDKYARTYVLNFKFNPAGTKELSGFTTKYLGLKVGLVIDNKLFSVVTIVSPIERGVMTLAGKFTEAEIDHLQIEIQKEVKRLRLRKK